MLRSESLVKARSVLTSCLQGSVLIYLLRWVRLNQFPELSFTMASMP
jgi:hypothetical protein